MTEHITAETLQQWRNGRGLNAKAVMAVAAHLAACAPCAARARESVDVVASAAAVRAQLESEWHPEVESELAAYADLRGAAPSHRMRYFAAAAAAVVAIAFLAVAVRWRTPAVPHAPVPPAVTATPVMPAPVQTSPGRGEWDALLDAARSGASLPMPAVLRELRTEADVLRGGGTHSGAVTPAGVVVETARPRFTWPDLGGADATVVVFTGEREVLRSARLRQSAWTADRELPRGLTYTWEVEFEKEGSVEIIPAAPAPPARFHIVSAGTAAELEKARATGDPLLIGLLCARAGLADTAREELQRVTAPADVPAAKTALRELDSWTR